MRLPRVHLYAVLIPIAFVAAVFVSLAHFLQKPNPPPAFGVTFSSVYARELGLNEHDLFDALTDDLHVHAMRIPVYWSEIEKTPGTFSWDDVDWLVHEAETKHVAVTLAVGSKVPRWPECFIPDWANAETATLRHDAALDMVKQTIERYRASTAVIRWQIENEAFFPFGVCPKPDAKSFAEEVSLVKRLDSRPIQLTVSGEIEPWVDAAVPADVLGISLYRVTWNNFYGYFSYPIPPLFYRLRAASVKPFVDQLIISELQAEPWFPEPIDHRTPEEWYQTFPAEQLKKNVAFAEQTGIHEVYLWGAEWWYYLKAHGDDRLWLAAKDILK